MSKLKDETRNLLRLIGRSPKDADGWAVVSHVLYSAVEKWNEPDLAELQPTEDGKGRIRLTEKGRTLMEWM